MDLYDLIQDNDINDKKNNFPLNRIIIVAMTTSLTNEY